MSEHGHRREENGELVFLVEPAPHGLPFPWLTVALLLSLFITGIWIGILVGKFVL